MNEWARQVLQAETKRQIAHAQRKASGLQFGDLEMCLQVMAETTADDDHGGQYIVEVLAELVLQCKAAGYGNNDYIAIGDSPQALADSNAHGQALEAALLDESKARQAAEVRAEAAELRLAALQVTVEDITGLLETTDTCDGDSSLPQEQLAALLGRVYNMCIVTQTRA